MGSHPETKKGTDKSADSTQGQLVFVGLDCLAVHSVEGKRPDNSLCRACSKELLKNPLLVIFVGKRLTE